MGLGNRTLDFADGGKERLESFFKKLLGQTIQRSGMIFSTDLS